MGLKHIEKAIEYDNADLDALKYQSLLLLSKGDLDLAHQSFTKLNNNSTRSQHADYKADAYLGLATVESRRSQPRHAECLNMLGNALTNLNFLPPLRQDAYTRGQVHKLQAEIYSASWPGADRTRAIQCFNQALGVRGQLQKQRPDLNFEIDALKSAMAKLQSSTISQEPQLVLSSQDRANLSSAPSPYAAPAVMRASPALCQAAIVSM